MQEAQCFRGLIPSGFLGEWTYLLGLAAGRCRGADAPSAHAGVFRLNQALLKPAFQIYLDL